MGQSRQRALVTRKREQSDCARGRRDWRDAGAANTDDLEFVCDAVCDSAPIARAFARPSAGQLLSGLRVVTRPRWQSPNCATYLMRLMFVCHSSSDTVRLLAGRKRYDHIDQITDAHQLQANISAAI